MIEKSSGAVSIIGGSDGPTSVFIAGKRKKTIKQRLHKWSYEKRKKKCERLILPGTHTMDEVIAYAKNTYELTEVERDSKEYQLQFKELRASFIMLYEPQLLEEYAERPILKRKDEEGIKEFQRQFMLREQKAAEVTEDQFPLNFHILEKEEGDMHIQITFEERFGHIAGSFSSSGNQGKRYFSKMYKDVYRYYGVTEEDIKTSSKRYINLVRALATKY